MTRTDKDRDLDTLAVGDKVWWFSSPCLYETTITSVADPFTYSTHTAPLGYYVASESTIRPEPEFACRSQLFKRPAERGELLAELASHIGSLEYLIELVTEKEEVSA